MKTRAILALTALAGLSQGANAQSTTSSTVTYTLGVQVIGGDGALPLNPGEAALIQISSSFSGFNTTGTWTPANPAPGSGTIRGFGSAFVDLNGTSNNGGNAQGAWNTDFVSPGSGPIAGGWDLVGTIGWGTVANSGANLKDIQYGQFPTSAASIVTANPINLAWQALWTPASFTNRTVTFTMAAAAASGGFASSVIFKNSSTGAVGINCVSVLPNINIPIAPAPASLALLGLGGLIAGRRRRA